MWGGVRQKFNPRLRRDWKWSGGLGELYKGCGRQGCRGEKTEEMKIDGLTGLLN
jgi:hypothetical protein